MTDGDESNRSFQVGMLHRSLQACVVGIVEDHLQGFPSDQHFNYLVR
jgi:hypothetical protein